MSSLLEHPITYYVTLIDGVGTRFEVVVRWRGGYLHLCEGWNVLGAHYKLMFGGWVLMTYFDDFIFHIRVRDRAFFKIVNPKPPTYYPIGSSGNPIMLDGNEFSLERSRYNDLDCTRGAYCKTLSTFDILKMVSCCFSVF